LLTLNLGASVETGKTFIFNFLFPITILGRNYNKLNGFSFALTMFLH